jgi:tetratricopeptide (TPR) repeat protein
MKQGFFILWMIIGFQILMAQETAVENLKVAIELNQKSEYESSLLFCNRVLELKPELSDAWFMRGYNNYKLENYKDAIVDFTVAINFHHEYAEAYFYRGKAKQEGGNLMGALKDLNEARKLDSSKSSFLLVKSIFTSIFGGSEKPKKENK